MSGQNPTIREITRKIINAVKKYCKSHVTEGSQILRKSKKQSTLKVWYLVIKCLRKALSFFLSLEYTAEGLSSSSESNEEESLEYNEAVQVFIFTVLYC